MFIKLNNRKAQSTLEYAVLIGVVVAGLVAMQVYIKRGFQGKLRQSADNMGEQFSPENSSYSYNTSTSTSSTETLSKGGATNTVINEQTSNKSGNEKVDALDAEKWWDK